MPESPPAGQLNSPACGSIPLKTASRGSGFYTVGGTDNKVQWIETLDQGLGRAGAIVIWGAGFDIQLRNWLQCRVNAGEIGFT